MLARRTRGEGPRSSLSSRGILSCIQQAHARTAAIISTALFDCADSAAALAPPRGRRNNRNAASSARSAARVTASAIAAEVPPARPLPSGGDGVSKIGRKRAAGCRLLRSLRPVSPAAVPANSEAIRRLQFNGNGDMLDSGKRDAGPGGGAGGGLHANEKNPREGLGVISLDIPRRQLVPVSVGMLRGWRIG